jgi:hypothetical protein
MYNLAKRNVITNKSLLSFSVFVSVADDFVRDQTEYNNYGAISITWSKVILLLTYLLTYLLTPWSRVLLEKLTVNFAAIQGITLIYGTRKFLTVPTSASHLSLS